MATYAVGDIQGCYHTFKALLERLGFDSSQDSLWLVGDLVNRGSGSLEILRWCFDHQENVKTVLGNHDLHAIAVALGIRESHKNDTLQYMFDAPDANELLTWLRCQPLVVTNGEFTMVHAGLLPQWSIEEVLKHAKEVEQVLHGDNYNSFFGEMYGNEPNVWSDSLEGMARLRLITNAMTRMRICTSTGALDFAFKGEQQNIPSGYMPWFEVPDRKTKKQKIICGHWSALGLYRKNNIYAIDTGCVWGGSLTAMCLETNEIIQVLADTRDKPLKV